MKSTLCVRQGNPLRRLASAAALLTATVGLGVFTPDASAGPSGSSSIDAWSSRVWADALSGRVQNDWGELANLPDSHGTVAEQQFASAIERLNAHLAQGDEDRAERIATARTELGESLEKDNLFDALRNAVEICTLSRDKDQALQDEGIRSLVAKADGLAREAESKGDWLDAHGYYYRLNLLFEEDARYKQDLERITKRLTMLRMYVPERLHEMRSAERVAEGEEPLPPFNDLGEDWREKLAGVERSMVLRAINRADSGHVEDADMSALLISGLESVRTLATTTDLVDAFPGLADRGFVKRFTEEIDELEAGLREKAGRAGYFDLTQTLTKLENANKRTLALPQQVIWHEFGNGAMETLDQFSAIIWPDELRQFQRSTQGKFTGVGIQISLDESLQLKVVTPLEGTPAHRAGIRPGDIIRTVDGESTLGITLSQAVDRITGKRGSEVVLGVEREGVDEPIEFRLRRDVIPIYSIKGWKRSGEHENDWDWFIDKENGIGYIRMTQFSEDTTREFDRAIDQMRAQELNGLIFDLRFNPGGLLSEAVSISNRFVDNGLIVAQQDSSGVIRESQRAIRGMATLGDVPVVVLINEGTASASEIVSGCLQDHGKAIILGARSYGKGSVQNVYDIGRGDAALKLTTQYYSLPEGRVIHRRDGAKVWGIQPDVEVEMLPSQIGEALEIRQEADLYLVNGGEPDAEAEKAADPMRLINEGVDTQLEAALVLIRSQTLPHEIARSDKAPAGAAGS
ncbi:MAG: S41 family peptidase [Phycisphaeraceae bacterium]|nr:S41 family peptidase [Phycisphaeraceae bacterium]